MKHKSRIILLAALVAVCLAVAAFAALGKQVPPSPASGNQEPVAAAAKTSFPGLIAATGEPTLNGMQTSRPSPGHVQQVAGPFDDRLVFEDLAFDGKQVTGAVRVTSDVSDLLELQVLAGFYDKSGAFLGTARFDHHLGSEGHGHAGPPEEREAFSIAVPAEFKAKAVSATVGVPVLVNE